MGLFHAMPIQHGSELERKSPWKSGEGLWRNPGQIMLCWLPLALPPSPVVGGPHWRRWHSTRCGTPPPAAPQASRSLQLQRSGVPPHPTLWSGTSGMNGPHKGPCFPRKQGLFVSNVYFGSVTVSVAVAII